jgi:L-iditol 2-dehydrogenase
MHGVGDLRVEQTPTPEPGPGQALVRVRACGICASDVARIFETGSYRLPLVPGHEFAGDVERLGPDAAGLEPRMRCTVYPLIPCGACDPCRSGVPHLCDAYDYLGSRTDGAFAEYVVAAAHNCIALPSDVDYAAGALTEPCARRLAARERRWYSRPPACSRRICCGEAGGRKHASLQQPVGGRNMASEVTLPEAEYSALLRREVRVVGSWNSIPWGLAHNDWSAVGELMAHVGRGCHPPPCQVRRAAACPPYSVAPLPAGAGERGAGADALGGVPPPGAAGDVIWWRSRPGCEMNHLAGGTPAPPVGEGVDKFKVGDRVATAADVPCGVCDYCRAGMGNNCAINYALGYQFQGGFAELLALKGITVDYGPVHHIPHGMSYETATLAEPLACCLNGLERSFLAPGDSVLVIGAGAAGILLVEAAKALGATQVILAQRSRRRLELARQFRADALIATEKQELVAAVMNFTAGRGVDIAITACASPEAQEQALAVIAPRGRCAACGRVNYFGGLPRGSRAVSLDSNVIHYKECYVHGSHGSVPRQHRVALDLLANGQVRAAGLITHRFALEQIADAGGAQEGRLGLKVLVEP